MISSASRTEMERGGIVPDAVVLELYQKMLTVFYVEERLKIFDRLGKVSFHASARGHEKLQIGMTLLLKPRQNWFVTYYREKGIAIGLGMSLKNVTSHGQHGTDGNPRCIPRSRRPKSPARTRCRGIPLGLGATVGAGHQHRRFARQLEDESVKKFNKPFDKLMETLAQRSSPHLAKAS